MSDPSGAEKNPKSAKVEGSGAVAQGPSAVAAGEGGIAVGGDVYGGIHIGDKVYARSQADELQDYLGRAIAAYEAGMYRSLAPRAEPPDQPYKFLYAFEIEDADIFFGRDAATEALYQAVLKDRLTVLHAKSGAGKTSLLNAGLSPRLLRDGRLPVCARAYEDPVVTIKRAIVPPSRGPHPALLEKLTLQEFLGQVCDHLSRQTRELVIILDQFEEFFVFWQERDVRQRFIAALADCYNDKSLNVRMIIALRKDYYSDLADFQQHIPTIFYNEYRLATMTRQDAQAAITLPVTKLGRQVTYEQALLNTLLDDLDRGGSELPHLQIICTRLYEALDDDRTAITLALYDEMGRAEGILGDYLNDVLERLPRNGGLIAQRILEELVSVEGTKRTLDREKLMARLEEDQDQVDEVLMRLVDARLLRRDETDGRVMYEMAHEYLIGEISLSPDVMARKEAEELLHQGVDNWERYDTLLSPEAFTRIHAQGDRLRMDEKAQELMLRTALRHGMSVGTWLTRMTDTERSLTLAQQTLCAQQGEPARKSLNTTVGDIQSERLQALTKRLADHWHKTRGSDRAPASDALWALRRHLPRRLRWRLALSRSPRAVRRAALPLGGAFIVLVLIAAMQWGPRYWTSKPSIDWVNVPEGEFLMGSDQRYDVQVVEPDAMPQHLVELDAFRIGRYEITNAQYAQCVRAKVCAEPGELTDYSNPAYADHPVVYVSWDDANRFCNWVGGRLPTEAEWEKAARGTDGRIYPWGNSPPDCTKANYADCGELDFGTRTVGSHTAGASPYGVQDMAGNVWEWVNDCYDHEYYAQSPARNPPGGSSNVRVFRGGCFYYDETSLPVFNRSYGPPSYHRDSGLGFRCAASKTSAP